MSQDYEDVLKSLQGALEKTLLFKYPSFVVNDEIRDLRQDSGCSITYCPEYGTDYFKFLYNRRINWDFDKVGKLKDKVNSNPRYRIINDRINSSYRDLVKSGYQMRPDNILNKILMFDIRGYEKTGFDGILQDLDPQSYTPGKYYDPYGDEGIEELKDAESHFHNRLMAAIDNNSMIASILFLEHGSDLFQKIESQFFEINQH